MVWMSVLDMVFLVVQENGSYLLGVKRRQHLSILIKVKRLLFPWQLIKMFKDM